MSNAKKLPSGNYRVQVYSGRDSTGKRIMESFTAPTKEEAELLASQYAAGNKRGVRSITVAEAIDRYIAAKTPVLSPPTIRAYRSYQANHYAEIAHKSIHKLTTEDMQLFISSMVGEVSPKTIANVYGLLAASVALFRPDKVFRVTLPKRKKERRESPSNDVVRSLFDAADPELQKCIALAALSLRRGEICALKHKDLNGPYLSVHADMVMAEDGAWVYKPIPKTSDSNRIIMLPQQVTDLLGDGIDDDYIISISPSRVSDRFIKLCKRLDVRGVRFHDLRHYFASIGAVIGIPDTYLASFGGWRPDSPVMKNVYQNVISQQADQYARQMSDFFDSLLQ